MGYFDANDSWRGNLIILYDADALPKALVQHKAPKLSRSSFLCRWWVGYVLGYGYIIDSMLVTKVASMRLLLRSYFCKFGSHCWK